MLKTNHDSRFPALKPDTRSTFILIGSRDYFIFGSYDLLFFAPYIPCNTVIDLSSAI